MLIAHACICSFCCLLHQKIKDEASTDSWTTFPVPCRHSASCCSRYWSKRCRKVFQGNKFAKPWAVAKLTKCQAREQGRNRFTKSRPSLTALSKNLRSPSHARLETNRRWQIWTGPASDHLVIRACWLEQCFGATSSAEKTRFAAPPLYGPAYSSTVFLKFRSMLYQHTETGDTYAPFKNPSC